MSKRKHRVDIDYVSFNLNQTFDNAALARYAAKPMVDKSTGQVTGIRIDPSLFKVFYNGRDNITASFWQQGVFEGMKIAHSRDLRVTRLDVCLDIPCVDEETPDELYAKYTTRVRDILSVQGLKPLIATYEGRYEEGKGNIGKTTSFWSRSGEKQLRLYTKVKAGAPGLRVEWQLRGSKARECFQYVRDTYPNSMTDTLETFKGITDLYLKCDAFDIENVIGKELVKVKKEDKSDSRTRDWAINIISKAFYRYLKSTGIDLCLDVSNEMQKLAEQEAIEGAAIISTIQEKREKAMAHKILNASGVTDNTIMSLVDLREFLREDESDEEN